MSWSKNKKKQCTPSIPQFSRYKVGFRLGGVVFPSFLDIKWGLGKGVFMVRGCSFHELVHMMQSRHVY